MTIERQGSVAIVKLVILPTAKNLTELPRSLVGKHWYWFLHSTSPRSKVMNNTYATSKQLSRSPRIKSLFSLKLHRKALAGTLVVATMGL